MVSSYNLRETSKAAHQVDDIRLLIAAGADLKVRSPNIGHTAPWRNQGLKVVSD